MPTAHRSVAKPAALKPAAFYRARGYGAEQSVGYLMRQVVTSMARGIDQRLESIGLTNAQWVPLLKLHLGAAATVAELARESQIDAGAMTRMIDPQYRALSENPLTLRSPAMSYDVPTRSQ